MKKAYVKTRRDYERELIALDEELSEIQMKMESLRDEYIKKFGLEKWNDFFDFLRHTC